MLGRRTSKEPLNSFEEQIEDYSTISEFQQQPREEVDETYRDYDIKPESDSELAKVLLETDSYINRIQLTLENKYLKQVRYKKDGKWEYTKVPTQIPFTKPLANPMGISQIVGRVKGIIHHAISLGNIDKRQYGLFLARFIRDFVRSLIANRKTWGIEITSLRDIRRIVVDGVQLYVTRPISNIERAGLTKFGRQEERQEDKGVISGLKDRFNKNRGVSYG